MRTMPTKIRPRPRAAEPAARHVDAASLPAPGEKPVVAEETMPPLPVLARLPEVSVPADHKPSLRLDWLKHLDWQHVRRMKLDPNWVAGGVLSLVLLLLLVITFNRSSKPAAEPASTEEAPAWSTAGTTPKSTVSPETGSGAPVSASTAVPSIGSGNEAGRQAENDPSVRRLAAEISQPMVTSLDGIYYPRTPFDAIGSQVVAAGQTAAQPSYGSEIRTAQRDVIPQYQSPVQSGSPQSGQAHFEGGIVTRPQH